jgi:hypothetical protein
MGAENKLCTVVSINHVEGLGRLKKKANRTKCDDDDDDGNGLDHLIYSVNQDNKRAAEIDTIGLLFGSRGRGLEAKRNLNFDPSLDIDQKKGRRRKKMATKLERKIRDELSFHDVSSAGFSSVGAGSEWFPSAGASSSFTGFPALDPSIIASSGA